jgi:hypothetical protein
MLFGVCFWSFQPPQIDDVATTTLLNPILFMGYPLSKKNESMTKSLPKASRQG